MKPWTQVVMCGSHKAREESSRIAYELTQRSKTLCAADRALLSGLVKRFLAVTQWCDKRLERME